MLRGLERTYLGGGGDKQAATDDYPTNHPSPKAQIEATRINSGHDTSKDDELRRMQQNSDKVACFLIISNDFFKLIFSNYPLG